MTIIAKFNSYCANCKGVILPGQSINWTRGAASTHADAAVCQASQALAAVKVAASAVVRPTVSLSGLVGFLRAAKEGKNGGKPLKFPKVAFAAPGNGEVVISLAGDSGKNPGALYVKLNGEYAGKVTAEGVAYGLDTLLPTLRAIEADPAGAGAAYGALRGHCSFCQTKLDDEGSLAVGYGPTCAKNYGLPHKAKGRAKSVPVVNVAPVADKVAAWVKVAEAAYDAQPGFHSQAGIDWTTQGGTLAVKTSLCTDCGGYHAPGRRNCDSYDAL